MKPKENYEAWLVYTKEGARKNARFIDMHKEAGLRHGIRFHLKYADELFSGIDSVLPDFAIVRAVFPELSKKLEKAGIPVFNSSAVSEICNDKSKTSKFIRGHTAVPTIPDRRYPGGALTKELVESFPGHVVKAVDGHGGKQVFRTEEPWEAVARAIGTSDFLIQPFVDGPGRDVRVYVIGDRIIGAVERTAKSGFRANYSLGGEVRPYSLSERGRGYVSEIIQAFSGIGFVGIDFLIGWESVFFNEIEDVVGSRMLYRCFPGIPLLDMYFSFICSVIRK